MLTSQGLSGFFPVQCAIFCLLASLQLPSSLPSHSLPLQQRGEIINKLYQRKRLSARLMGTVCEMPYAASRQACARSLSNV
jgi:hypothetical protein